MSEPVENKFSERARNNLNAILRGLTAVGQVTVSRHLKVSEPTISKMKDPDNSDVKITFEGIAKAITSMGYQIVPADHKCVDPKKYKAVVLLAKDHLDEMIDNDDLLGD